jgi:hypothetical protein
MTLATALTGGGAAATGLDLLMKNFRSIHPKKQRNINGTKVDAAMMPGETDELELEVDDDDYNDEDEKD